MRYGLNLCGGTNDLLRLETSFRINQVTRENRINQRRFPQSRLPYPCALSSALVRSSIAQKRRGKGIKRTDDDYVELEAPLEEFVLNLMRDGIESNAVRPVRSAGEQGRNGVRIDGSASLLAVQPRDVVLGLLDRRHDLLVDIPTEVGGGRERTRPFRA